jgi:hypothetical protein
MPNTAVPFPAFDSALSLSTSTKDCLKRSYLMITSVVVGYWKLYGSEVQLLAKDDNVLHELMESGR